jgi:hypothetical protein
MSTLFTRALRGARRQGARSPPMLVEAIEALVADGL